MSEIRTAFHKKVQSISDELIAMGELAGKAIEQSVKALQTRDLELAHKVISEDPAINTMRFEIEEKCIQLIATQQPMASDLRILVAILNIIIEIERIGDHGEGIAKIVILIGDEPPLKPLIDIPRMAAKTVDMLRRSLTAFVARNAEQAREIALEDDFIDNLYEQIFHELVFFMLQDPKTVTRATRLLWVGHNLERSADRVTNICERVVYLVTGKMEEIKSKY